MMFDLTRMISAANESSQMLLVCPCPRALTNARALPRKPLSSAIATAKDLPKTGLRLQRSAVQVSCQSVVLPDSR